jgi:hypothetical protein
MNVSVVVSYLLKHQAQRIWPSHGARFPQAHQNYIFNQLLSIEIISIFTYCTIFLIVVEPHPTITYSMVSHRRVYGLRLHPRLNILRILAILLHITTHADPSFILTTIIEVQQLQWEVGFSLLIGLFALAENVIARICRIKIREASRMTILTASNSGQIFTFLYCRTSNC